MSFDRRPDHENPDRPAGLVRVVRAVLAACAAGAGAVPAGLTGVAAVPPGRHHLRGAVRVPVRPAAAARPPARPAPPPSGAGDGLTGPLATPPRSRVPARASSRHLPLLRTLSRVHLTLPRLRARPLRGGTHG